MKREFLTRIEEVSDPRYGKYPASRDYREHIRKGIVIIDKPSGPTSHQVAAWVKDILDINKAGHSGTLDPKTTGLLLIALEKSAKTMPLLMGMDKEYVAIMELHKDVKDKKLEEVLEGFRGEIEQLPPKRSAVKREIRTREIKELEILDRRKRHVLLRVSCQAGTYVRKLIHNIGQELGWGAHMKELRRTRIGPFGEEDAVKLQDLKDACVYAEEGKEEPLKSVINPVEIVVDLSKVILVKDTAIEAVCNGAPLGVGGISKAEIGINKGDKVCLLSGKGELVAIGEAEMDAEETVESKKGKAVSLMNVIMDRGTYPKGWK